MSQRFIWNVSCDTFSYYPCILRVIFGWRVMEVHVLGRTYVSTLKYVCTVDRYVTFKNYQMHGSLLVKPVEVSLFQKCRQGSPDDH